MQEMTNNTKKKLREAVDSSFLGEVTTGPITQTVLKKFAKMADEDKTTLSDIAR
jgi:hypothetical protein